MGITLKERDDKKHEWDPLALVTVGTPGETRVYETPRGWIAEAYGVDPHVGSIRAAGETAEIARRRLMVRLVEEFARLRRQAAPQSHPVCESRLGSTILRAQNHLRETGTYRSRWWRQ